MSVTPPLTERHADAVDDAVKLGVVE